MLWVLKKAYSPITATEIKTWSISINSKTSAVLCFHQFIPDLQILATSGLFSCPTVSLLQNVMEYVVWLLSFSTMHSGLMYVAVGTNDLLFLLLSDVPFFGCNTIWSSIYQLLLFSHSVVLHSLRPHGLQHARLPCPSPSPRACSNSCPSSQWCHPTISSSVALFHSSTQSFPGSESFPMSQLFVSGGQSIGASASVLPMNIQGWFPLGLTGLIFLLTKRLSRVFSSTTVQKH